MKKKKSESTRTTSTVAVRLLSIFVFLLAWHLATYLLKGLPAPLETFQTFVKLIAKGAEGEPGLVGWTLQEHTLASIIRVLEGAGVGFAVALPLGILMGWSKYFEKFAGTMIEILRPIPPLAWIPLAFVIFMPFRGSTVMLAQIFVVFVGAFFPAVLNTVHGVRSVDKIYIDVARTLGASNAQILKKVVLPGALPSMITGIRIGLGVGWMCLVAAEMIGASTVGIGSFIWNMYTLGGRNAEIISGMIAIGIVGYAMNEGILFIERRLVRWG